MPKFEMRELQHLWITYSPGQGDVREVIIDEEHKDVRLCDGAHVVKICWNPHLNRIDGVLVDDIYVWQRRSA